MRRAIFASFLLAVATVGTQASGEDGRAPASVEVVAPAGAQIAVDGKPLGTAPLGRPLDLAPGDHDVSAVFDGATHTLHVNAARGFTSTASFLVVVAPPTPVAPAAAPPPSAAATTSAGPAGPEAGTTHGKGKIIVSGVLATGAVVSGFAGLVSALASRSLASRASGLRSQQSDSYCYGNPNALHREWARSLEQGPVPDEHVLGDGAELDVLVAAAQDLFARKG